MRREQAGGRVEVRTENVLRVPRREVARGGRCDSTDAGDKDMRTYWPRSNTATALSRRKR